MQRRKVYELASFKALPDEDGQTGRFEALVSVFGNVDFQGDRVLPGAFTKSIERWQSTGDPIPVIWSHDWADPFAHIGMVDPTQVQETDAGLKVAGQLDINKPFAKQVYDLLRDRRVKQWSFAYEIVEERPARDKANELVELSILEVGPTLAGANPETDTLSVKSVLETAAKAGRALSTKNESALRQARDLIDQVLESLYPKAEEEEETPPPKSEDTSERDELRTKLDALTADL